MDQLNKHMSKIADMQASTSEVSRKRTREKSIHMDPCFLPQARKEEQPFTFAPQLATLGKEVPKGDSWIHEIKYDTPCIAFLHSLLEQIQFSPYLLEDNHF